MDPLDYFEFSQSSLQDFTDCRRRFQLRYLQHVAWPAVQAEPARENERHIQRGDRFHRLAQQYLLGVSPDRLAALAESDPDENLQRWWQNFLNCIPTALEGARHVEVALRAPLGRFFLVAKYDLVLVRADGRAVIYDWKTGPHRPARARLLDRLQTRVYPYLLALAGSALNPRGFTPEAIEMVYWFAEPDQPVERLTYTPEQFAADGRFLLNLVEQIQSLKPEDYQMAATDQGCGYCVYRSLCGRGVSAGDFSAGEGPEQQDTAGLDFDLEQIGEISF